VNFDVIKQVLDLMREHELAEFELEQEGLKIRVRKHGNTPVFTMPAPTLPAVQMTPGPVAALTAAGSPAAAPAGAAAGAAASGLTPAEGEAGSDEEELELAVITSPIVGTFYRAPDPSSPPFVDIGQTVRKGQTLCIIEAMKLMNEIESEYEGQVVKVYVENGQPVQYGERIFAIKRG
jgi:acetyl-CoA carboxylase biotin carboxyl carrier protein